jgi:hypothetical protein
MKIARAPAAHRGVTMIMGVGAADELAACPPYDQAIKAAGAVSVGVWVVGMFLGSSTIRNIGFGGALATFGARMVARGGR